MKYNRLPFLTNTYPQTGNYITTGLNSVSLYGIYADVNKVDFTIPDINQIKVVDGTSFRNIIALYKDQTDNSPKYYTSEIYSRDLEASKIESNPYLINYSLQRESIVKIYVKDIVETVKSYREEELKLGVAFTRNNFLLYGDSGLVKTEQTNRITSGQSPVSQTTQNRLSELITKIEKFEIGLLNADANIELKRGLFYGKNKRKAVLTIDGETFESSRENWNNTNAQRQEIKQKVSNRLTELKAEKSEIDKQIETQLKNTFTFAQTEVKIKVDPNRVDNDIKKILGKVIGAKDESDIIEIDGQFVDCVLFIKYIDWILSKPSFQEIENNGVIAAEELSVFKTSGELTDGVSENNQTQPKTPVGGTKRSFTYQIIRLSIPASLESSRMTFVDQFGQTKEIQTDKYGLVGEYCVEEDSWDGSYLLYQRTQLEPCNVGDDVVRPGRKPIEARYGGNYDNFREQSASPSFIDYNRDNAEV